MNKKLLVAAGAAGIGLALLLRRKVASSQFPGYHPVLNPSLPAATQLAQLQSYYNALKSYYSDDPTLADQVNQAMDSATAYLSAGFDITADQGYQMWVSQVNQYVEYRETTGYIAFTDMLYGVSGIAVHPHGPHECYCPGCGYIQTVDTGAMCNQLYCPMCGTRMRASDVGERRK